MKLSVDGSGGWSARTDVIIRTPGAEKDRRRSLWFSVLLLLYFSKKLSSGDDLLSLILFHSNSIGIGVPVTVNNYSCFRGRKLFYLFNCWGSSLVTTTATGRDDGFVIGESNGFVSYSNSLTFALEGSA